MYALHVCGHFERITPILYYRTQMATDEERYVDYLDFSPPYWKRPSGPPRIWRIIDGRKKTASGEIPRFSIQEVPEELENDVVKFMVKYYIGEEPICVDTDMGSDPLALREYQTFWKGIVRQGVSVVAFGLNSDPTAKSTIAGVNILTVVSAEDEQDLENMKKFQSKGMKKLMGMYVNLIEGCDVLKIYNVDKYLDGVGLSVHPSFRGQGLGEEILRARDDIGLAYQIPVSETIFTGPTSQLLATRVGFELLIEKKYSEILDDEGKIAFAGLIAKSVKCMGKRLSGCNRK